MDVACTFLVASGVDAAVKRISVVPDQAENTGMGEN